MSLVGRPGVLDQAFAWPLLMPDFSESADTLPSVCDHIPILLQSDVALFRTPHLKPNWALTDWPQVDNALKSLTIPPPPPLRTFHSVGDWFDTNHNRISATMALHTPLKHITHRAKLSWSTRLSALRKGYNCALYASKKDSHDSSLLMSARAPGFSYFKVIKKARRDPWCEFLAMVTPQTIWMAKRYAIGPPPP